MHHLIPPRSGLGSAGAFALVLFALCCPPKPGHAVTRGDGEWVRVFEEGLPLHEETPPAEAYRLRQQARRLFGEDRYAEAAVLFEQLTRLNPEDGGNWYNLAWSCYRSGQFAAAARAYQTVIELGVERSWSALYNQACMLSLAGEKERALAALEACLAEGWENRGDIAGDADFDNIRDDPRFAEFTGSVSVEGLERHAGWQADLGFLAREAHRLHWQLRHGGDGDAFDASVARLHAEIPELSDDRVVGRFQELMASLGDGHSVIYPHSTERYHFEFAPVRLHWFADGLFIVDAHARHRDLVGQEIIAIGDTPVDQLPARLESYVSRDNPMGVLWMGAFMLRIAGVLRQLDVLEEGEPFRCTLRDRKGGEHEVQFELSDVPIEGKLGPSPLDDAGEAPRWVRHVQSNYWMEDLPEQRALYVQYNQVRDDGDESIVDFAARVRARIDEAQPDALLLDLRHNNGGNSFLNPPMLRSLIHFENTRPDGRLFVFIGRSTFSAAMNFLSEVDYFTDAILVGEPSGSAANFVGESTEVQLPWSGLNLSISSRFHQSSHPTDHRVWISPQIPVRLRSVDYFANRDPAMEAVLEILAADGGF